MLSHISYFLQMLFQNKGKSYRMLELLPPMPFTYLFVCLFTYGCIGSSLLCAGFLQLQRAGGYSSLRCTGFSLQWLLLLQSMGSRHVGFSSWGEQAQQLWRAGSRAQAQQLWHMGLVAPRHAGSSLTRAQTCVPCIGRWILNHCATGEAPNAF